MKKSIAVRMFGDIVKPYITYFKGLEISLKKSTIKKTVQEYVSYLFFFSLMSFIVSLILSSFFVTLTVGGMISAGKVADMLFLYTLSVIISIMLSAGVFLAGYYYPSLIARNRRTKIERSLPFAVFHMRTAASSGVEPSEIFRSLSTRGGVIGKEAERIYNDVKSLGMSITAALDRAAARSPSPEFAEILWGLSSVITTGGSIEDYLSGKTKTAMNQYRRSLNDYAKNMALYTEIYITLVIVGSLFSIVLTSMISPLAGNTLLMQSFLVFFVIPMVSIAFIVLIRGMSPSEY